MSAVVVRVIAGLLAALTLVSCGAAEPTTTEVFREYLDATNVRGDPFPDASAADRRAAMASTGSADAVRRRLFAAEPCGDDLASSKRRCGLNTAVAGVVEGFTGPTGTVHRRAVLVKTGGPFEWVTLYVARRPDGSSALVDTDSRLYLGGLDDFRRRNELLQPDDWVLAPRDITATPGGDGLAVVSGQVRTPWELWLVGGAVLLVAVGVVRLVLVRRRAAAE